MAELPSLSTASRRSNRGSRASNDLSFLDNIGSEAQIQVLDDSFMNEAELICTEFIGRVHASFPHHSVVTGNTLASLQFKVTSNSISILGSPVILYQDLGVQGSKDKTKAPNSPFSYTNKKPPIKPFKDWVMNRNIIAQDNGRYMSNGSPEQSNYAQVRESPFRNLTREQEITKLAYAMSMKIFKEGFKPLNFFTKHVEWLINELQDCAAHYAIEQIKVQLATKLGEYLRPNRHLN